MAMVGSWLQRNLAIYFGNAASVRDFRSQLRGNRAVILWTAYLSILIFISGMSYVAIVSSNTQSVSEIQSSLRSFYQVVTTLLATMIIIVSPAMTAGAIVMERQRRSLDLVLTTPIEPKYLLVGKMLSSYRYVWMLLVLSLPITSTCVVMGGATWQDVLAAYILLSACGIIFTAIGLLMSTIAPTIVSAMIYSYLAIGFYCGVSSAIAGVTGMMGVFGSRTLEAPWVSSISPFGVAFTAQTYTVLWAVEVPNWVFVLVFALAISKVLLLGAASILSPYGARDTKSLRIHGILYTFLLSLLLSSTVAATATSAMVASMSGPPGSTSPPSQTDFIMASAAMWLSFWMFLVLPNICCFGPDGGMKHRNDGVMSLKGALLGTPAGAVPYLVMLWLALVGGNLTGIWIAKAPMPGVIYWYGVGWALTVWFFWWGWARYLSSFNSGLRAARAMLFIVMILLVAIPFPILSMYFFNNPDYEDRSGVWKMHMLYPAFSADYLKSAPIYAVVMLVATAILSALGAAKYRNKVPAVRFEV